MTKKNDLINDNSHIDANNDGQTSDIIDVKFGGSTKEDLLQEYNSCILCGQEKLFTHVTDFCAEKVHEESFCPECNIKNKKTVHQLH